MNTEHTDRTTEVGRPRAPRGEFVARYAMVGILLLIVIGFSVAIPETYFTYNNLVSILSTQCVLAILVVAMIFPLVVGQFDLTVGVVLGMSHVIVIKLAILGVPLALSVLAAIAAGTLVGLLNGLLVTRIRINALIATIGMGTLIGGLVYAYTKGRSILAGIPESLLLIGRDRVWGIPVTVFWMIGIVIVAWYVLERTPLGRQKYAIGGSPEAARLAGINVSRLTMLAFLISGTLAGVAGVFTASRIGVAQPDVGPNFLLPAFAASFLGAAVIKPGTFNVAGGVVAVFTLAAGVTGLQLLGLPFYIEPIFNGAALIIAVSLTRYLQREAL